MVVVVGGVMTTQEDGNTAHKAKDHSRDAPAEDSLQRQAGDFIRSWRRAPARWRAGCAERRPSGSGRASSRPLVRKNKYGAMILLHRAKSNSADIDLRDRVERQLDWEPEVTSTKIGVGAEEGVVTLTGFVDTYAEKLAAERIAKRTYGVRAVANDLQVKPLFKKTDSEIASWFLNQAVYPFLSCCKLAIHFSPKPSLLPRSLHSGRRVFSLPQEGGER